MKVSMWEQTKVNNFTSVNLFEETNEILYSYSVSASGNFGLIIFPGKRDGLKNILKIFCDEHTDLLSKTIFCWILGPPGCLRKKI